MAKSSIVLGDREVDATLAELPRTLANGILRKASRDVCKSIVLPDARRRMPKKTGKLAKSLTVRTMKGKGGKRLPRGVIGHQVVADTKRYKGTFVALFLEFGTKIREAFGKKRVDGEIVRVKLARGRIKPFHSMRDALYKNRDDITAWYVERVRQGLPEAVAKAKSKAAGKKGTSITGVVLGVDARIGDANVAGEELTL